MTSVVEESAAEPAGWAAGEKFDVRLSVRPQEWNWPATRQERAQVWSRLSSAPFAPSSPPHHHPGGHALGVGLLLDWLEDQPGRTWQERWLASGADVAGSSWRQIPITWLRDHGHDVQWRHDMFFRAVHASIAADLLRPSLT